ncbi:ABC transporter ATP-binding protein [Corynebacterium nuruki]|uniref:ABC transporter ATP-binding protein n=1 Tax=Corynebacterium nuruki TaxID=1032851 RepID=UPI0039BFB980
MPTVHPTVHPSVQATGLTRYFRSGDDTVTAVEDVSLTVGRGEIAAVIGPSGSGKSTLLQLLAGLDRPDAGTVAVGGVDLGGLRDRALTRLRREKIGFIFQDFQLLPRMTARQNITLPVRLAGGTVDDAEVDELAGTLGVAHRLDHRPGELSGGQQQRVAVARALLGRPDVVFADEPTGALDSATAADLVDLFIWAAGTRQQSFVIVTHDERVAARADSVHRMTDGHLTAAPRSRH